MLRKKGLKVPENLHALMRNKFLVHNIIFFTGAVAVGVLNYLYYPVLGRMLEPADFGEVQTLVSLFLQLYVLFGVLGLLTVTIVTHQRDEERRNSTIIELERFSLFLSIALLLLATLGGRALQEFFHFSSALPFAILAVVIAITVPFTFRSSYLRGHSLFGLNSWALIIGAGGKLVFSVIFVLMGWGVIGAILGIAVGQLIAFWYAAWQAKVHGFAKTLRGSLFKPLDLHLIKPELKYGGLILVCTLVMTLMYSIDIIIVKHLFDAHTAGLYAGVAAVARIPFFLTASVPQVLMAAVMVRKTPKENQKILLHSSILLLGIGGGAALFFILFPAWTVGTLMGATYLPYAYLLPTLGMMVFVVSVVNLFVTYHLVLRRWSIGFFVTIGAVITSIILYWRHATLEQIVESLLIGSVVMLLMLGLFIIFEKFLSRLYKTKGAPMAKGGKN